VRSAARPRFTNPYTIDATVLDVGGGLAHLIGSDLHHFNTGWREIVDFGRRYPIFYLFAVRGLSDNRPKTLARFEMSPAPFLRADEQVQGVLDEAERMIAAPASSCSAVDDLPAPEIFIM
jgi:hypothetical protein